MNMAVDLNELKFLILVIMLAANICREWKDFKRAFYFYHQAVLLSFSVENCCDLCELLGHKRRIYDWNGESSFRNELYQRSNYFIQKSFGLCLENKRYRK